MENVVSVSPEVTAQILSQDELFREIISEWFILQKHGVQMYRSLEDSQKEEIKKELASKDIESYDLFYPFYDVSSKSGIENKFAPTLNKIVMLFKKFPDIQKMSEEQRGNLLSESIALLNIQFDNEDSKLNLRDGERIEIFPWWNFECNFPLRFNESDGYDCDGGNAELCVAQYYLCLSMAQQEIMFNVENTCVVGNIKFFFSAIAAGVAIGTIVPGVGNVSGGIAGFSMGLVLGTVDAIICADGQYIYFQNTLCPSCQNDLRFCCD